MSSEAGDILQFDAEQNIVLSEEECEDIKPLLTEFVGCYAKNKEEPVEDWLNSKMQEQLPDRKPEEVKQMTREIVSTLEKDDANRKSLSKAVENGRSKEEWFATKAKEATSAMSMQGTIEYLTGLDSALQEANEALYRTITTKAGMVSQNPRLDGFIAEQYHVQTFNMNAEATGSQYRAKVLEPEGTGYAKNSVDVVILDGEGKIVRRYQSKYYKDAKATERAFQHGDYRGQRKLVPEGQEGEIGKKVSVVLEAPDGTTSNPLTKSRAEQMKTEAQSGNWNELNWSEYDSKELAIGIGKKAGAAALQGAAIGVGFDIAKKVWNGEKVEVEEEVETAILSGADFGLKAATAGALQVAVDKGKIPFIPQGTPAETVANIAFVAIENVKVIGKVMLEDLSVREGIDQMEQTTVATVAGLAAMEKGSMIGMAAGTIFGSVGATIGGFVGGAVGYIAGSKFGETIVRGAQKVRYGARKRIREGVKKIKDGFKKGIKNMANKIKNLLKIW